MNPWIAILLFLMALGAFHFLMRWMETKGWVYWTKSGNRRPSTAIGNAMLEVDTLLRPNARKVIEMREQQTPERDDTGGDAPDSHHH